MASTVNCGYEKRNLTIFIVLTVFCSLAFGCIAVRNTFIFCRGSAIQQLRQDESSQSIQPDCALASSKSVACQTDKIGDECGGKWHEQLKITLPEHLI